VQRFNVHLKLTRSQLNLAHNAKVKTDMPEKNEKQLECVESVRWVGGKAEELWKRGFVEKMSFEPGVEERSNGWWQWWWRKWRTDVWDQIRVISLHDQQAGEVPCEADSRNRVKRDGKKAVNLQRGRERWAREGYYIWKTSASMGLNSNKIA